MRAALVSRRQRVGVIAISIVGATALASTAVLQATSAAFSAQTTNTGNAFATSNVDLTDNKTGSALFNVSDMNQGESATQCIEVSYEGTSDPQQVKLYSGGYTDSSTLGEYLNVRVDLGSAGSTCAAFVGANLFEEPLDVFDFEHTGYANGVGGWNPAAASPATPEMRPYRIRITLDNATPNSLGGESVSDLVFIWEVRS